MFDLNAKRKIHIIRRRINKYQRLQSFQLAQSKHFLKVLYCKV